MIRSPSSRKALKVIKKKELTDLKNRKTLPVDVPMTENSESNDKLDNATLLKNELNSDCGDMFNGEHNNNSMDQLISNDFLTNPLSTDDTTKKSEDYELDLSSGWTRATAQNISLLLLLPQQSNVDRIIFEYEWVDKSLSIDANNDVNTTAQQNKQLANMLRRLIHLANTEFTDHNKKNLKSARPERVSLYYAMISFCWPLFSMFLHTFYIYFFYSAPIFFLIH